MATAGGILDVARPSNATTYSFTSGSSNSAATAANYTPTLPTGGPSAGDTLVYAGKSVSSTITLSNVTFTTGNLIFGELASGTLTNTATTANSLINITGTGDPTVPLITQNSAGTLNIVSATYGGTASGTGKLLSLNFTTSGTLSVASGGTLGLGLTINDGTSGGTRLTKVGAGTLNLGFTNLTNNLTGGITVSAGSVRFFSPSQLGVAPAAVNATYITLDGGTLNFSSSLGNTAVANEGINITANNGTFDQGAATSTYIEGAVISGPGMLTKAGLGSLTLSGANTFSGGLSVNAGIVNFSTATNLGDPTTGVLTLNGGEIRDTSASNISLESNRAITLGASGGTFDVAGGSATTLSVPSTISGVGALTKNGLGTLYLNSSANSYAGGVIDNAGTIQFFNKNAFGAVPAAGVANFIQLNGASISFATSVGDTQSSRQGFAITGVDGIDVPTSSVTYTVAGTVSGTGTLTKTGSGTLTLSAVNSYTGGTTIAGGTVSVAAGSPLGSSTAVNPITLAGGALNFSGSLTSTPLSVNRPIYIGNSATAGTGTVGVIAAQTVRFANSILDSTGGGMGSFVKANTGTLVLENSSSYTGPTTVLGGTLLVNAAATPVGTGVVTVGDGATNNGTFGGVNTINNTVDIKGGSAIAAGTYSGTTPATFTINAANLTLENNATEVVKIGASTNDTVSVTGNGNIILGDGTNPATLSLFLVDVGGGQTITAGETFVVAQTASPGLIQNYAGLTVNIQSSTFDPTNFTAAVDPTDTMLILTATDATPEPASLSIMAIGGGLLLRRRRRII